MEAINPHALKYFRLKRKLSQADLAQALRCTTMQVSRWETGKTRRLRRHLRERLTEVLKVAWEDLVRPPEAESNEAPELEAILPKVPISARIGADAANALKLASLRYGVDQREIVELAPLLFTIAAERSLLQRKERLKRVRSRLAEAVKENASDLPHLPPTDQNDPLLELLDEEADSIAAKDIFGTHLAPDAECPDPFVNFLRDEAAPLPQTVVSDINANFAGAPAYHIAWDTLQEVTGIKTDGPPHQNEILNGFACGFMDLRAALAFKSDHSDEKFEQWCRDALDQYRESLSDWAGSFTLEAVL